MKVYRVVYMTKLGFKTYTDIEAVNQFHAFVRFNLANWGCRVSYILSPGQFVSTVREPIQAQLPFIS